jgi:hypothetical protein
LSLIYPSPKFIDCKGAWCRWPKTNGVGIKYQQFVSSVHRSFTNCPDESPSQKADPDDTMQREPKKLECFQPKGCDCRVSQLHCVQVIS